MQVFFHVNLQYVLLFRLLNSAKCPVSGQILNFSRTTARAAAFHKQLSMRVMMATYVLVSLAFMFEI